jgi:pimeloyl-ACP methyl ester carboxylesterase
VSEVIGAAGMQTSNDPGLPAPGTSPGGAPVSGVEHWAYKGGVRLFLWEKFVGTPVGKPAVLFVHGSSMASQPTFDLRVPGRPDSSAMDWFARRGFACWSVDMEGYGRSDKSRDITCDIANGADDLAAATDYMAERRSEHGLLIYGISSGALRAALFAQRHPERVSRLALDAFVWTGIGAPTLEQRRKKLSQFLTDKRRPIDRAFVHSIFERDHPETADKRVVDAFADAILALDDSMPNGTYVDMCSKLPVVDPSLIAAPTLIMRGQYDGIAAFDDLIEFFKRLPAADKQFTVMPGISHASKKTTSWSTTCCMPGSRVRTRSTSAPRRTAGRAPRFSANSFRWTDPPHILLCSRTGPVHAYRKLRFPSRSRQARQGARKRRSLRAEAAPDHHRRQGRARCRQHRQRSFDAQSDVELHRRRDRRRDVRAAP